MGGGGLRILPHKKWHVWRRDNIERVLRDEREHEEKQQELADKQRRVEQERRAQKLVPTDAAAKQHVNLFQAEEEEANTKKSNKRRDKKNQNSEDTLGKQGKLPWYAQAEETKELSTRQERKRKRELESADPLQHMRPKGEQKSFAARLEDGPDGSDRRKYSARYARSSVSPERSRKPRGGDEDERSKKRKRRKEKKKSKKDAMLEELRRERLKREESERRRAQRLMN